MKSRRIIFEKVSWGFALFFLIFFVPRGAAEGKAGRDSRKAPLSQPRLNLNLENEEIRNIIREMADLYDLNVVLPESLRGEISLRLRQVTWEEAFSVILEPAGFSYSREGNIIWIKNKETLLAGPLETRVFILDYTKAEDMLGIVAPLLEADKGERATVFKPKNALLVTAGPSKLNRIEKLL